MTRKRSEILLSNEPDVELFKSLLDRLTKEFDATFIEKAEDLDSKYFDFEIKDEILTLHLQTFIGITLFPKIVNEPSEKLNQLTEAIGFKLKYSTTVFDTWVKIKDQAEAEINYVLENVQEARSDRYEYKFATYQEYADCKGHEHCDICNSVISCNGNEYGLYSTLRHLTCQDCFEKYVDNDEYVKEIEQLEKIRKLPPTRAIPNKGLLSKLKGWFS